MGRLRDERLVFLDLETTGGNAGRHRILEVGLIEVQGERELDRYASLINPECSVTPRISAITGITSDMVSDAPRFAEIAPRLAGMLDGAVLIAHNARFDHAFLRNEFRRLAIPFTPRLLCTVRLARRLYPGRKGYSLDALIARHGLECDTRHRALADAQAMLDFYRVARREHGDDALEAAAAGQLARPTLPPGLDSRAADNLPDGPGVYLFYDADDRLLYVGKSVSLRSRVLAHFSGDHRDPSDLRISRQLARVHCLQTAGELEALLTEARLVKTERPVYNRRLKRQRALLAWQLDRSSDFHRPVLTDCANPGHSDPHEYFGLFRSRRAAIKALTGLCTSNALCLVRCGLEKRTGPCFAYQLGKCRGACAGRERAAVHNLRLAAALAALRISAWPFEGIVGLREKNPLTGRQALQVVDNWCWLGSAGSMEEVEMLLESQAERRFDLDIYRVLKSWLRRNADRPDVVPLTPRQMSLSSF